MEIIDLALRLIGALTVGATVLTIVAIFFLPIEPHESD